MNLLGIHHLTAISARIRDNHHFYTRTLGMRLVKRSVNQDDVSAYHLFYADARGTPGTDLTFFDWPVPAERRGTRSITRTSLRVAGRDALEFWKQHLASVAGKGTGVGTSGTPETEIAPVRVGEITERDGRLALDLEDFEGQRLSLVDDGGAGEAHPWERSPIDPRHQVRGLGPIEISVPDLAPTDAMLQRVLGMRPVREYAHPEHGRHTVHVYEMGPGGPAAELHVAVQPDFPVARSGAGGVHHVAFRTADADYDAWADRLNESGLPNSGKVDRYWFRSLYVREPNGVLFEIASDGPGFAVDEDPATLGEKVVLAPFLEPQREAIVSKLKPID